MNIEDIEKQHLENYKKALCDLIENNTTSLLNDDFKIIFEKPPLDSMDTIKTKLLSLAKKNKIVLDNFKLDSILSDYRNVVIESVSFYKEKRIKELNKMVKSFKVEKDTDTFIVYKKDLDKINKDITKKLKEKLGEIIDKYLINHLEELDNNDNFVKEGTKYLNSTYLRQVIDDIAFKVLIKDMTLINGIKSQGERFLFTKENSHLYDD